MKTTPLFLTILALIVTAVSACGDNPAAQPGTNNPINDPANTTKFDVVWSPKAVVFDKADMADLQQIDSSVFRFHFNATNPKAQSLKAGSIVVLNNYAIRKVTSVQNSGGKLIVNTTDAEITEAMTKADISWNHGIEVSPRMAAQSLGKMAGAVTTGSNDSIVVSFSSGKYSVEFTIKHKGEESEIKGKMTKKHVAGGPTKTAMFTMSGTLKKFRSTGAIRIRDGKLEQYEVNNNGVDADFVFTAVAAGSGNDIGIEIPIPLLKFPLPELPFLIFDLKALVIINAVVPTDGSCDIGMRLKYKTDQGIEFDPQTKNVKTRQNMDWKGFTPTKAAQTAASGPIGVNFGMAYPKMELTIVGTKTGASIQASGLIGGDFTMFPVCRQAKASAILAGGLTVGIDGLNTGISKTIWRKDTTFLKSGECPP